MSAKTGIEWADATWNPIVGCSVVSPGCTNCYAMRFAGQRLVGNPATPHYAGLTRDSNAGPVWTGKVAMAPERTLTEPLRRRKPTAYFVNSMGDLFHEAIPDAWIDLVFAVMALAPQHTFIVLTKRAKRMLMYLAPFSLRRADGLGSTVLALGYKGPLEALRWPLPNVVLGVSAERQQEADERIPDLLATPAAKRIISAEPLLGPISFRAWMTEPNDNHLWGNSRIDLDGVIVGGESGPGARPMHPDWARSIRDQCAAAGVAFHFKQWGEWAQSSYDEWQADDGAHKHRLVALDGRSGDSVADLITAPKGTQMMRRLGKARAGRLLDGCEHDDLPWRLA